MRTKSLELAVGLFVIIGIASLVILGLSVSNLGEWNKAEGYSLSARFENIGGLKVRAPIKIGGVVVGRVTAIELDNKSFSPVVRMHIKDKLQLPTETNASITTAGLLGEQFISLSPGGNDEILADGGEITDTQSALVLENLISQFLYGSESKKDH